TFLYVRNPGQDLGTFISGIWFLIIPFIIFALIIAVAYYKPSSPPEPRDKSRF
ncbi:MAG: hypothetical protein H7175_06650, partial [Burkholderiales bacterium]|nr:hypothetical protein [Anaerolineae bacterium]